MNIRRCKPDMCVVTTATVKIFRFGPTQKTAVQLLGLVPSIIVTRKNTNIEEMSEMYQSDLPSPWTLDIEYDRWSRKWKSEVTKPDSLQQ